MAEIVSYRRRGGYAGISQMLRVHDDGRVELQDRKTRKRSSVMASHAELATLRSEIEALPADRWHSLAGAVARRMLPNPRESMRFEIRCGRGRLGGASGSIDSDLGPLLGTLDELLARAVRENRDPALG